jgi:hypothetical protein
MQGGQQMYLPEFTLGVINETDNKFKRNGINI